MNINSVESCQMDYNSLYYNIENGDIFLKTKYFYKQTDYTEFIKHIIMVTNNSVNLKETHFHEKTFNIFIDLEDTKLKNFDRDFLKQLIKFLEDHYPDRVNKIYFKNASVMFKSIWTIIRPFIGRDTRKKIIFEKKIKVNKPLNKPLNKYNEHVQIVQITEDNIDDLF